MDPFETRRVARFQAIAAPHFDAAYNLARWLTQNDHDADDVVQEALLRAMRYCDGFRGENARAWLLAIVRRSCFDWLRENRPAERTWFDDDTGFDDLPSPVADEPLELALRRADRARIDAAIGALPAAYREVFVLRELEDLSYLDIARIADIPVGTVMSRLSRGRALLRRALAPVGATARPVLRSLGRNEGPR